MGKGPWKGRGLEKKEEGGRMARGGRVKGRVKGGVCSCNDVFLSDGSIQRVYADGSTPAGIHRREYTDGSIAILFLVW